MFVLALSILFPIHSFAQYSAPQQAGERVRNYDSVLDIQNNGTVNVKERIVYDFGDLQKHGIYRNIPIAFQTKMGWLKTRVSNISVTDEPGAPYGFTTSYPGNDLQIKIGDANVLVSGEKTYDISYTISRAINFFSDHDELYWNVTGNGWQVPILEATAKVSLPGQVPAASITAACYSGLSGSTSVCGKLSTGVSGADFSQTNLGSGGGLTIVVGFPKGIVAQPTLLQKIQNAIMDNWVFGLPVVVFLLMWLLWYKKGRDPETSPIVVAQYEAPGGLSPAQVGELVELGDNKRGVTAEIITLAVLGYLKIRKTDDDYEFTKLKEPDGKLKDFQSELMLGLFSPGKIINLSDLKNTFYTTLHSVNKKIKDSLITGGLFASDPATQKAIYVILGVVVAFGGGFMLAASYGVYGTICAVISGVIILVFGLFMPKRTLLGAQTQKQVLGLKLYLNVAEKDRLEFHNAPEKTPERFEKLLPYAIALGVEKGWAKQFEGIYNQPPSWYNDNYSTFNTLVLVNSLNNFHSASASTLSSTPSSAAGGGSGFGGGGFSGGGFGGGGGGSW